jgi:hypothetical protein
MNNKATTASKKSENNPVKDNIVAQQQCTSPLSQAKHVTTNLGPSYKGSASLQIQLSLSISRIFLLQAVSQIR